MAAKKSSSSSTETESSSAAAEESATPLPSESSSSESSESSEAPAESSESSSSEASFPPSDAKVAESTGGYPRMFSGSQPAPAPVIVEPTGPVTLSHLDLRDLFTREIARLKHLLDEVRPLTVEHLRETLFKKHL